VNDLYVKAPKQAAESVRRRLIVSGVFDGGREIVREGGFILFPVLQDASVEGCPLVRKKPVYADLRPRSLRGALEGRLSESELRLLPSSFDVIGDIAVIEIPDGLLHLKNVVGEALLRAFSSIRVAAMKSSPVSTEFRVRGLEVIAGENRTVTLHREFGCVYRLDVASAYFSPRLGGERMRVAGKVSEGERVLVMFAGVGPYAILIAKTRSPAVVVAVELNPLAVDFMEENARINKVNVNCILGDVRAVVPSLGLFDRIVMPLPKDAGNFLDVALPALCAGGVVHFYDFAEKPGDSAERVAVLCGRLGYEMEVLDSVCCGSFSPKLNRVCVDFKVVGKNI